MTDTSRLWPKATAEINWWGHLAGALGWSPGLRPLLICLRGVRPGDEFTHPMRSVAAYDDCGIFVYAGGQFVFPMSSHAYQVNSKLSPDVDGDGRGDVGTITPGRYLLRDLHTGKYPTFLLTMPDGDGHIPCHRDTDHDGVISHAEERVYTATQILLHGGIDDPPDSPHHFSIGCQCAALKWRKLMVEHAPGGLVDYELMLAENALPLVMAEGAQANA